MQEVNEMPEKQGPDIDEEYIERAFGIANC